jgi:hypothetical protein
MEVVKLPEREGAIVRLNLTLAVAAATVQDGREVPLTIYLRPENVRATWTDLAPEDLSWPEKVVLAATKQFRSNIRMVEVHNICALGEAEYEVAKHRLIERGLLDTKGAITLIGLNAIGSTTLEELAPDPK